MSSTVYSNCTKIVLIRGMSAVAYISAGVALYYFYTKHRDRNVKAKGKRKAKRSTSRNKATGSPTDAAAGHESKQSLAADQSSSSDDGDGGKTDCDGGSGCESEKQSLRICGVGTDVADGGRSVAGRNRKSSRRNSIKNRPDVAAVSSNSEEENKSSDDVQQSIVRNSRSDVMVSEAAASTSVDRTDVTKLQSTEGNEKLANDEDEDAARAADGASCSESSSVNHDDHLTACVDGEVSDVMMRISGLQSNVMDEEYGRRLTYTKSKCIDSPSVSSDVRSEGSQDSGKGTSMGLTSSTSPVGELIELPPMYEFEVPQDIVGLIIGRKGTTIKYFTEESGAHIVIRHHHFSQKHKICTLEGTREQINKCLRLIRHKFPPSRFPELKLTPLLPPAVVSPHSPVFDSIINLNLPAGVNCEVVLSSMLDAGHFFVQQPTHPTFPSLSRLDQYMLAVYNQAAGIPGLSKPVNIGIICVAPVLAGWFRAQIVASYEDTDEVMLKFVDYGGYSTIPNSDLRQIRSDFMNLPFQAVECSLAHVKPVNESEGWTAEANMFFEQSVHGKVAETILVGKCAESSVSMVELYCLIDGQMEMINKLLVDNGFAVWMEEEQASLSPE